MERHSMPMPPHPTSSRKHAPAIIVNEDDLDDPLANYFGDNSTKSNVREESVDSKGMDSDGDISGGHSTDERSVKASMKEMDGGLYKSNSLDGVPAATASGPAPPPPRAAAPTAMKRSGSWDSSLKSTAQNLQPLFPQPAAPLPTMQMAPPIPASYGAPIPMPSSNNYMNMNANFRMMPPPIQTHHVPSSAPFNTGHNLHSMSNTFIQRQFGAYPHPMIPSNHPQMMIHEDHSSATPLMPDPYVLGHSIGSVHNGMDLFPPPAPTHPLSAPPPLFTPPAAHQPSMMYQQPMFNSTQMKASSPPIAPINHNHMISSPSPGITSSINNQPQNHQGVGNNGRVFQQRDWRTGRMWREDNHTGTTTPCRRQTTGTMEPGGGSGSHRLSDIDEGDESHSSSLSNINHPHMNMVGQPPEMQFAQLHISPPLHPHLNNNNVECPRLTTVERGSICSGSSMSTPGIEMKETASTTAQQSIADEAETNNGANAKEEKKSVKFGNVNVRTYETIIGDNPACSSGPSLGIGWRYDPNHVNLPVDTYESSHQAAVDEENNRRYLRPRELVIDRKERQEMLKSLGYRNPDFVKSVRSIVKAKSQRKQTVDNLKMAWAEERVEACAKMLGRMVNKRERSRHLYDKWKAGRPPN